MRSASRGGPSSGGWLASAGPGHFGLVDPPTGAATASLGLFRPPLRWRIPGRGRGVHPEDVRDQDQQDRAQTPGRLAALDERGLGEGRDSPLSSRPIIQIQLAIAPKKIVRIIPRTTARRISVVMCGPMDGVGSLVML